MRSAIVLGGGMVGVGTALHLQSRGWSVALVDRREPGRETSYGNAGIIQSEAVKPYAMPHDLGGVLEIALARTNDVHYRLAALPYHVRPLLSIGGIRSLARHEVLTQTYAQLIARAAPEHEPLITAAGAGNLVRRDGFRVIHRQSGAVRQGVPRRPRRSARRSASSSRCSPRRAGEGRARPQRQRHRRPALAGAVDGVGSRQPRDVLRGAVRAPRRQAVARRCDDARAAGSGWAVTTEEGRIEAEAAVVALGPWSPEFLKRFGYDIPMVRKRGYHRHYTGGAPLDLPLRDAAFGYLMNPMARGVRITTGAELSLPDAKLNAGAARQGRVGSAPADRSRQAGGARAVARHAALHARHAAGRRAGGASQGSLAAFRARPSGIHAGTGDGPHPRRADERRSAERRRCGLRARTIRRMMERAAAGLQLQAAAGPPAQLLVYQVGLFWRCKTFHFTNLQAGPPRVAPVEPGRGGETRCVSSVVGQ
jgi:D-amino-acid dehydrogenase